MFQKMNIFFNPKLPGQYDDNIMLTPEGKQNSNKIHK